MSEVNLDVETEEELDIPNEPKERNSKIPLTLFLVCALVISISMFMLGRVSVKPKPALTVISSENWPSVIEIKPDYTEQKSPADHPPPVVSVEGGNYTFHYTLRSEMLQQHCTGETNTGKKQIWLPADADGREIRETVIHELMHISLASAGGEMHAYSHFDDGESVINPAAMMFINIMRDNPALIAWIEHEPNMKR